jgi:hypothetical protein
MPGGKANIATNFTAAISAKVAHRETTGATDLARRSAKIGLNMN